MSNYLMLNGKRIDLTAEQIADMKQSFGIEDVKLSDIKVGETFRIGEYEFIVLEQSGDTTAVILKDLLHEEETFGSNNNYDGSNVDKLCNEFGEEIENIVGSDNLVEHTVDLTADDGLKCYGTIKRKLSLITAEQYRKYVYILDEHKISSWWWLATPHSTDKHENANWVKCVSPRGGIYNDDYDDNYNGVRPFCILKSNIFVSK